MTDYRETIGKSTKQQTEGVVNRFVSGAKDTVDDGVDKVEDTVDTATDVGSDTVETVDNTISGTQDSGGAFGIAGELIDEAVETSEDTANAGVDAASDAGDTASGAADTAFDGTADFLGGTGTGDEITDTAGGAFDSATEFVDDKVEGTTDAVNDFGEDVTGGVDDAVGGATDTFNEFTGGVTEFVGDGFSGAGDVLGGGFDAVEDFTGDTLSGTEDIVSGGVDKATDFGGDAFGGATDLISGGLGFGGDVLGGAADFGTGIGQGAINTALGTVDFGTDVVGGGIDGAFGLGQGAVDLVTGGGDGGSEEKWGEPTEVEQMGRCVIQKQESNQGNTRYMTATANSNNNPVALRSDGSMFVLDNAESMSDIPFHDTLEAARSACEAADLDRAWGELEQFEDHNGGVIMVQSSESGDERYFALTADSNGNNVALATDGSTVALEEGTTGDELPSFPTPEAARKALNENGNTSRQWGQMEQVSQVGQCVIMRQVSSDDNERYFTFTQGDNGEPVAMANDGTGTVVDSVDNAQELPHYPTQADAEAACPESPSQPSNGGDQTPTDDSTSESGPTSDNTSDSGGSSGGSDSGSQQDGSSGSNGSQPTDQQPGSGQQGSQGPGDAPGLQESSIFDMEIAGLPLPLVAGGAAAGLGAISMLFGGDDSGSSTRRSRGPRRSLRGTGESSSISRQTNQTRTQSRQNVNQRSGQNNNSQSSQSNGNNGGN